MGFDTDYQAGATAQRFVNAAGEERILLTRTRRIRDQNTGRKLVFITANDPFEQVKEGKIKAVVGKTLPLKEASLAHKLIAGNKVGGNVVLLPWAE